MKRLFFFTIFALIISGCVVSRDDFYTLEREVAVLKKDFGENAALFSEEAGQIKTSTKRLDELHTKLRKSFAETNSRIEEIEQTIAKLKGNVTTTDKKIEELTKNVSEAMRLQNNSLVALKSDIKNIMDEINRLKTSDRVLFSNISTTYTFIKAQVAARKENKEVADQEKKNFYDAALNQYKNKEYEKAIQSFEQYTILYPYDNLTPNALYWIGECFYALKKFDTAITYFHLVVTDFPNSNKVPSALLKEAFTLEELGMSKESQAALEELLFRFPYSDEAKEAKKFKAKKKI